MRYSEELKAVVIERALEGSVTQDAIAEEFGVSRSTVQNWMRGQRASGAAMKGKDKRPRSWTTEERLEALLATHGLSEEQVGAWCRERGIHTHHLAQWRQELVAGSGENAAAVSETRALRQEVRGLKQELRRKDKALAETAALLVLKKKAASIWGEVEDD
jgi:transposase-like protein